MQRNVTPPADEARAQVASSRSDDRLLSIKDCAGIVNCHPTTIWRMVSSGTFPKPMKFGHLTRWSESEVGEFITIAKRAKDAA